MHPIKKELCRKAELVDDYRAYMRAVDDTLKLLISQLNRYKLIKDYDVEDVITLLEELRRGHSRFSS